MIKPYDFSIEIIKKYCLIVKNIESFDIDILSLLFKSIDLQFDIIKYKKFNNFYENIDELENFVGCFLTGTAAEVTPVASIDKYKFKVCNTIIELSDSYQKLVRKKIAA